MWRKVFSLALLLLLCLSLSAGSPAGSAASPPDPAQMTDEEILLELGLHWEQQLLEQDESRKTLQQVLTIVESSQRTSERLQISLGQISRDAMVNRELIAESSRSWQSSSAAVEKELRRLRIQNNILLAVVVVAVASSLAGVLLSIPP